MSEAQNWDALVALVREYNGTITRVDETRCLVNIMGESGYFEYRGAGA